MAGRLGRAGSWGGGRGGRQGRGGGRRDGHNDDVLDRMATVLENMASSQAGGLGVLAEFKKADPPRFEGGHNPEGAARWLQEIEKILEIMECQVAQKIKCAAFMLIGEAENWWRHTKQLLQAANREVTWAVFRGKFLQKYFPDDVRRMKEIEFLALKQGSMSVDEYATKFEELLEFSTYYQNNGDARALCMRFEDGLRPEIRLAFCNQDNNDLTSLLTKCRHYEDILKAKEADERRTRTAPKGFGPMRDKGKEPVRRVEPYPTQEPPHGSGIQLEARRYTGTATDARQCNRCGRFHSGFCRKVKTCFICHQPGHFAANCPNQVPKKEEVDLVRAKPESGKQPLGKAGIYVMSGRGELIKGICFVYRYPCKVLFDSGTTYSFVLFDG